MRDPMPTEILMPALSPTMTEGKLAKWLKGGRRGQVRRRHRRDRDRQGDHGGRGGRRRHARQDPGAEGTEGVAVNTPIAVLLGDGESAGDIAAHGAAAPKAAGGSAEGRGAEVRGPRRPPPPAAPPASPRPPPATDEDRFFAKTRRHDRARGAARRHGRGDAPRPTVFLMGEEVAEYQGAYKVSQGLLRGVRRQARHRHADHRARLRRPRRRRRLCRAEADRRVHDLQLRHAGDRPDHQLGRQDALHVRRPDGLPDRVPRPQRRRLARRRPAQPGLCQLVRARARA